MITVACANCKPRLAHLQACHSSKLGGLRADDRSSRGATARSLTQLVEHPTQPPPLQRPGPHCVRHRSSRRTTASCTHVQLRRPLQEDNLMPQMTALETTAFCAELILRASTTPAQRRERAAEVLTVLGLAGKARTMVSRDGI